MSINAVAPLAGAWIEIGTLLNYEAASRVAPLAGAWIEITYFVYFRIETICRSPRGSVD